MWHFLSDNLPAYRTLGNPHARPQCKRSFKCSTCLYVGRDKKAVMRHAVMHACEKPFACNLCPYTCAQLYQLKGHKHMHTKQRPFKCSQCSYSTKVKATLVRHAAKHTSEKPLACDWCRYTCAPVDELKTQVRSHKWEDFQVRAVLLLCF